MTRERKRRHWLARSERRELMVLPEVAAALAEQVRELQQTHYALTRALPLPDRRIEYGQEYITKNTLGGRQYFLQYHTVVRALLLAESDNVQSKLIEETLRVEKEVAIFAFKDLPDDDYIFVGFWSLVLFLEKLIKDERLEVATIQLLTELYLNLWAHLEPVEEDV